MYGSTYFKWYHYFLFMLLGATVELSKEEYKYIGEYDLMKLTGSIVIYYTILPSVGFTLFVLNCKLYLYRLLFI